MFHYLTFIQLSSMIVVETSCSPFFQTFINANSFSSMMHSHFIHSHLDWLPPSIVLHWSTTGLHFKPTSNWSSSSSLDFFVFKPTGHWSSSSSLDFYIFKPTSHWSSSSSLDFYIFKHTGHWSPSSSLVFCIVTGLLHRHWTSTGQHPFPSLQKGNAMNDLNIELTVFQTLANSFQTFNLLLQFTPIIIAI